MSFAGKKRDRAGMKCSDLQQGKIRAIKKKKNRKKETAGQSKHQGMKRTRLWSVWSLILRFNQ